MPHEVEFEVIWRIEVSARDAEEAARYAREIQLDPDSTATVFEVYDCNDEMVEVEVE